MTKIAHQEKRAQPEKASYTPPTLKIYGDLAQLTNTVGRAGNPDGGSSANGKNFTH